MLGGGATVLRGISFVNSVNPLGILLATAVPNIWSLSTGGKAFNRDRTVYAPQLVLNIEYHSR
jgi:hypothetical protein